MINALESLMLEFMIQSNNAFNKRFLKWDISHTKGTER